MEAEANGPTGVGVPGPGLSGDVLEHLRLIASSRCQEKTGLDAFVSELDDAAAMHEAAKGIQAESNPGVVRSELAKLGQTAIKLVDCLNDLGGRSRHLLYTLGRTNAAPNVTGRDQFDVALDKVLNMIAAANRRAEDLPRTGGRPPRYSDLFMSAHVAHAMRVHLKIEPSSTRGGLFEELLKTMIEALEPDREDPSVRDLIRQALCVTIVEHPGGLVEFELPVE